MLNQFYELNGLKVTVDQAEVLKAIECYEDSPIYAEILEEYHLLWEDMKMHIAPVGVLGFGAMPESAATAQYPKGTPIAYVVLSIGNKISQYSTIAFEKGDYVKGMLCDAIADEALFSLEADMLVQLAAVCKEHSVGVLKSLAAPHDISMQIHREAWEYLDLKTRFDIGISSGNMFDPIKTLCKVFVLTEDMNTFHAEHDCRICSNLTCRHRNVSNVEVIVRQAHEMKTVMVGENESLMDALIRDGYYISAFCGGKGRCGKCKVQVCSGNAPVSSEDEKLFSKDELKNGWRLSCMLYPTEALTIALDLIDESEFEVVSEHDGNMTTEQKVQNCDVQEYDIAIDIGTTTLAFELVDKETGRIMHTVTTVNSQRKYGADVISRIQASVDGKKKELQESIQKDLLLGIEKIVKDCTISVDRLKRIIIAGNTTMIHLLKGYDCDSLGIFPFEPINIKLICEPFGMTLGSQNETVVGMHAAETVIMPGISTYVGGDIVSGLYANGFAESDDICLLIDLGTNGEMALGNRDKILVTSTAAGPAFEGGNIVWGMGSVAGAICSVKINGNKVQCKTIRDEVPCGICGTGVVETVAELVNNGFVDETGLLDDDYFDDGFPLGETSEGRCITFTQKDVREIQLAKAAIRAGVETLLLRYKITMDQVSKVYLAGGFGYRLDTKKAVAIGMLPEELSDRVEAVGNSSLAGAVKYLSDDMGTEMMQKIISISEEIALASDADFNEFYMNAMMFDKK